MTFNFKQPQDVQVKTQKIDVKNVTLDNGLQGIWKVQVSLPVTYTRQSDATVSLSEIHCINATITITPDLIASFQQIPVSDVKNLTLDQLRDTVTEIGLSKVLYTFNIPTSALQA